MKAKKATPVKDVLVRTPLFSVIANKFCEKYGLKTIEQFTNYSRSDLLEMTKDVKAVGVKTIDYITQKIQERGLKLAPENPKSFEGKICGFKIVGKNNVKNYILEAMASMGGTPASRTNILYVANRDLAKSIYNHLRGLPEYKNVPDQADLEAVNIAGSIFSYKFAFPLFDELKAEGKIRFVEKNFCILSKNN